MKIFSHPSIYLATQWKPHKRIWWLHLCSRFTPPRIQKFTFQVEDELVIWLGVCMVPFLVQQGNVNFVIWLHRTKTDPKSGTCKTLICTYYLESSQFSMNKQILYNKADSKDSSITKNKLFVCKLRNGSPKRVRGSWDRLCLNSSRNFIVEIYDRPGLWTILYNVRWYVKLKYGKRLQEVDDPKRLVYHSITEP